MYDVSTLELLKEIAVKKSLEVVKQLLTQCHLDPKQINALISAVQPEDFRIWAPLINSILPTETTKKIWQLASHIDHPFLHALFELKSYKNAPYSLMNCLWIIEASSQDYRQNPISGPYLTFVFTKDLLVEHEPIASFQETMKPLLATTPTSPGGFNTLIDELALIRNKLSMIVDVLERAEAAINYAALAKQLILQIEQKLIEVRKARESINDEAELDVCLCLANWGIVSSQDYKNIKIEPQTLYEFGLFEGKDLAMIGLSGSTSTEQLKKLNQGFPKGNPLAIFLDALEAQSANLATLNRARKIFCLKIYLERGCKTDTPLSSTPKDICEYYGINDADKLTTTN